MKVQHPWRGRVFQYQVMIRLLNYQQHASQGLLRDPLLLRGINMMPSTRRHFLESRHLIICWTRCTIKLLRPNKRRQHNLKPKSWGRWISVNDFDFLFPFLITLLITPFWNLTTVDYCKRRMSRNMTSWLIVKPYSTTCILRFRIATNVSGSCDLAKKSWKFHPQINRLRTTNHSLRRNTEKIHLRTPNNQWMEYLHYTFNPVNYKHVDISTIRWVSGSHFFVWFLLGSLPVGGVDLRWTNKSKQTVDGSEILHHGIHKAL